MLLKSGAGPNKATEDGMTPVHVAAKFGNLATLVLLLEDGGDPLRKTKVCIYDVVVILCILHLDEMFPEEIEIYEKSSCYVYFKKQNIGFRQEKRLYKWPVEAACQILCDT